VYCSQKQQSFNKSQESDIIQNFHERYYKHKNRGPPIVTRLQFDQEKLAKVAAQSRSKEAEAQARTAYVPTPEDEELERRFRKLREQTSESPPTLTELQDQFDKFKGTKNHDEEKPREQDNNNTQSNEVGAAKTEFEQAQDLIQQLKEEVELDNALEGKERAEEEDGSVNQVLNQAEQDSTASKRSVDTDPEALLNDLQRFTAEQEEVALNELQSSDIQSVLATQTPNDENLKLLNIEYPIILDEVTPKKPQNDVSSDELKRLIQQAATENELDKINEKKDKEFLEFASNKLSHHLENRDSDEEEEVKRKPQVLHDSKDELNFNWQYYDDHHVDEKEFDHEVNTLIQQMTDEAKLEQQLEASGITLNKANKAAQPPSSSSSSSVIQPYSSIGYEEESLPWCCMCNADANIKCFDCDDDLYCVTCFSHGHEQFGLFDHRYEPFNNINTYP
jgi:hypothetical protein